MSKLKSITNEYIEENRKNKAVISYSQFSIYNKCPYHWYKNYVEGVKIFKYNINLLFGDAMHQTIQEYITTIYREGGKAANNMNLNKLLLQKMKDVFLSATEEGYTDFTTQEEMSEFYQDGVAILDFLKKKRNNYFGIRNYELVGIEVPLFIQLFDDIPNVMLLGYIDLIIKNTISGKYEIIDIKTSTAGWKKYQKKDENKVAQLKIYKKYFSKQYNIDEKDILIKFFIVKRKLQENLSFPQKRIQEFTPTETKKSDKKLIEDLRLFVSNAFDENGNKNTNGVFLKKSDGNNCKWCEYNTEDKKYCDKINS